jgi:hypothetical protein
MPLKFTLRLNLGWSCLLLAAFLTLAVLGPTIPRVVLLIAPLAFGGITWLALRGRVWALLLVIGAAVIVLARWLPMVIVNVDMFLRDDPLYLDSPATILIVAIYAVLLVGPALILVMLYLVQWRKVLAAIRREAAA